MTEEREFPIAVGQYVRNEFGDIVAVKVLMKGMSQPITLLPGESVNITYNVTSGFSLQPAGPHEVAPL